MVRYKAIVIFILTVTTILFSAERGSPKKRNRDIITVIDLVTTFKSDKELSRTVSDRIRDELLNMDAFTVLEEGDIREKLLQNKIPYSDTCQSLSSMVNLGHCIGARYVLYGSVASLNDQCNIVLRLLNVPRGEIVNTISKDLQGDMGLGFSKKIKTLVEELMENGGNALTNRPQKKKTGTLFIDSDIVGADIIIDGKQYDMKTPHTFENFPAGKHRIAVVSNNGYGTVEVNLEPGASPLITIPLLKKKETVNITSTPTKAEVIIDGKEYG